MILHPTVDELLSTTRSVRRRLGLGRPVAREVILDCLHLAVQAPSGSNRQGWHFIVAAPKQRSQVTDLYGRRSTVTTRRLGPPPGAYSRVTTLGGRRSSGSSRPADRLAEHVHEVPDS